MQLPPVLFWGDAKEDLYKSPKMYFNQSKDKHKENVYISSIPILFLAPQVL